jgi:hypothetical protein
MYVIEVQPGEHPTHPGKRGTETTSDQAQAHRVLSQERRRVHGKEHRQGTASTAGHQEATDSDEQDKGTAKDEPVHVRHHQRPKMVDAIAVKGHDFYMIGSNTPTVQLLQTDQETHTAQQGGTF